MLLKDRLAELSERLGFRYFLVDRLCVKQDDETDKANEIPRMRDYFQGASGCLVLLGPDVQPFECVPLHPGAILSSFQQILRNRKAIESLAKCTWTQRIWTLQEALVSRQVIYAKQNQLIDGDFISELVAYCSVSSEQYEERDGRNVRIRDFGCYRWNARAPSVIGPRQFRMDVESGRLTTIQSIFGGEQQCHELCQRGNNKIDMRFEQALALLDGRRCQEKEDVVYGILGLTEGAEKVPIEYDQPWREMLAILGRAGMITERQLASSTVNSLPGMSWLPQCGDLYGPILCGERLAAPVNRPVLPWPAKELVVTGETFKWRDKEDLGSRISIHGMQCYAVRGTIDFPNVPNLRARVCATSSSDHLARRLGGEGTHVILCKDLEWKSRDTVAMLVSGNVEARRVQRKDGYVLELHAWVCGDPASLTGKLWVVE